VDRVGVAMRSVGSAVLGEAMSREGTAEPGSVRHEQRAAMECHGGAVDCCVEAAQRR